MIKFRVVIALFLAICSGCAQDNRTKQKKSVDMEVNNIKNSDINKLGNREIYSNVCLESFKNIRQLIHQKSLDELKSHFSFPIQNSDVWNLAMMDNEENFNSSKDFSEKDFDSYFGKIFSKRFVNSLLKIKSNELF